MPNTHVVMLFQARNRFHCLICIWLMLSNGLTPPMNKQQDNTKGTVTQYVDNLFLEQQIHSDIKISLCGRA